MLAWFIARLAANEALILLVDWSKFYSDHVLAAAVPSGKRAVPVFWAIANDDDHSQGQNTIEYKFFNKLIKMIPGSIPVIIVVGRGFGRTELLAGLDKLDLGYIIRVKDALWVESQCWQGVIANYPFKLGQIIPWEGVAHQKRHKYKWPGLPFFHQGDGFVGNGAFSR